MFERYTESARRVLFFARFEAGQLGGTSITTDHMLLGLTREAKGVICEVFAVSHVSLKSIRHEIERRSPPGEKTAATTGIPFSDDVKTMLRYAAEEADRLMHPYIGTEHLLLGLLRADGSSAAATLTTHGLHADAVRQQIVTLGSASGALAARADAAAEHVDRIKQSIVNLAGAPTPGSDSHQRLEEILRDLDALKRRFLD
jgi:ATP-dependent Clp protease ATP-binding subunit ClpC